MDRLVAMRRAEDRSREMRPAPEQEKTELFSLEELCLMTNCTANVAEAAQTPS
jgi:hypothetical protein